jgi:hypothetical protein
MKLSDKSLQADFDFNSSFVVRRPSESLVGSLCASESSSSNSRAHSFATSSALVVKTTSSLRCRGLSETSGTCQIVVVVEQFCR